MGLPGGVALALFPALAALDPAEWGLPLSPAGARFAWETAIAGINNDFLALPLPGRPTLLVTSSTVFTAPLPWMALYAARGVQLRVKAARGMKTALEAMARVLPGVEVWDWRGGDIAAEAEAIRGMQAAIVFGSDETVATLKARLGIPVIGFGSRFGVGAAERGDAAAIARDVALYDGRGCMSPTAFFLQRPAREGLGAALEAAERRWPRGEIGGAEAAAIRERTALARVVGRVTEGAGWTMLELPPRFFRPLTLPRVLTVHPFVDVAEVEAVLNPHGEAIGTFAGDGTVRIAAPRVCRFGEMQTPVATRWHDGVDVVGALGEP